MKRNWIAIAAVFVHLYWGLVLLTPGGEAALGCTPMASTPMHHSRWIASALYLFATATAVWHLCDSRTKFNLQGAILLGPQQALLMLSAGGAVVCVANSAYADGVPRPWQFISADQMFGIVGMVCHTLSLIDWFYWSKHKA